MGFSQIPYFIHLFFPLLLFIGNKKKIKRQLHEIHLAGDLLAERGAG